ncbi:MAG: hypothetical protein KJ747_02005 [Actinobacteria bacterium]|nr:hypothetical protein [Actinomycetota bacterium]MCG2807637.1 hypothetical protein [Coriobacteriia bacterium]
MGIFTILPTVQLFLIGFLSGFDSDAFLLRLWATCFLWLAAVVPPVLLVPLFAPRNRRLLLIVRAIFSVVGVVALAILGWLNANGMMETALLLVAGMIFILGWSGTLSVQWFASRMPVAAKPDA